MALRNQPYLPLYVQDYLTDEKLNLCKWSTQGIYIKIMCILHKQNSYGSILFKQNSKQNSSSIQYFASVLVKNLPCQIDEMISALEDLVENEVLIIDEKGLHQKRMVRDGEISEKRSQAAKKGGGNPNLFKQKSKHQFKQNPKQNTEYEYEYENENIIDSIIKEYNKTEFPKILKLSDKRKSHLMQRIKEYKPDKVIEVIRKANASDFLRGKNNNKWQATFDWIINPSNFLKILEGNYDNKEIEYRRVKGGYYDDS